MSTIAREQQKQILVDTAHHIINRDNTSPHSENLRDLARIALASLEAEPVAFVMADDLKDSSIISTPAYRDLGDAMERTVGDVVALYAAPPSPVSVPDYPETLPCPVMLEPGFRFGKGVPTKTMLGALQRRAEYYAEVEAMTPDQRANHDAGIKELAAMLQGAEPVTTAYKLPELRYLDTVKFNADCALQDPESIYALEFFMSLDEVFGERGNYTEPVQAKAVSILIAEIFRLRGYPAAPQQDA